MQELLSYYYKNTFHETVFFHDHDHDRYTCDDKPSCKMANKATHQSSSHKKMNITVFQNVCGHFLQISIKVLGIIEVIELPHFSLPARCQNGGPSCLEWKLALIIWLAESWSIAVQTLRWRVGRPRGSQLGRKKNSFAQNVIKLFVNLKNGL